MQNDDWRAKHYMKHHLFVFHAARVSYTGAQVLIKTVISAEQQSGVTWLTSGKLHSLFKFKVFSAVTVSLCRMHHNPFL